MNKENCALKLVDEIILYVERCLCFLRHETDVMLCAGVMNLLIKKIIIKFFLLTS